MNDDQQIPVPDRIAEFPPHWQLADSVTKLLQIDTVDYGQHRFPDQESLFRVLDNVQGASIAMLADLHDPDPHFLQLVLLAETLHDMGAASVGLLAPYLPYMRQDKRFNPGEAISSRYFADALSPHFDWLMTVDPHLHRYHSLSDIYPIPNRILHATLPIATWLNESVTNAVLIGPDEESEQWVSEVAAFSGFPHETLIKQRHGDNDVEVSFPHPERWQGKTPVLLDDIISSGHTMMAAVSHLRRAGFPPPLCIAVHGVFAPDALAGLKLAGAGDVVTTNTIPGATGRIDISNLIADSLKRQI